MLRPMVVSLIAALLGAGLAAAMWVAMAALSGEAFSWMAWGVGLFAGLSAGAMARNQAPSRRRGLLVACVAFGAGTLGWGLAQRAAEAHERRARDHAPEPGDPSADRAIGLLAGRIAHERQGAGLGLGVMAAPAGSGEPISPRAAFSPEVWAEAERAYVALRPSERQDLIERSRLPEWDADRADTDPEESPGADPAAAFDRSFGAAGSLSSQPGGATQAAHVAGLAVWLLLGALTAGVIATGGEDA